MVENLTGRRRIYSAVLNSITSHFRQVNCRESRIEKAHAPGRSLPTAMAPAIDLASAQSVVFSMVSLLFRIGGRVRVCGSTGDIRQCMNAGILAPVLHIEGAEAIDPNFELLEVLYAVGLRSLGPVWSRSNAFGHGVPFRWSTTSSTFSNMSVKTASAWGLISTAPRFQRE
jgi:microsomal dipeptidase-like Zn-dependent dipeptidase